MGKGDRLRWMRSPCPSNYSLKRTITKIVTLMNETSSVITVPSLDETVMTPSPKGKAYIVHLPPPLHPHQSTHKKGTTMINILYLYPDLLNLYGDHANVSALEKYLEARGVKVNIDRADTDAPIDFSKYHMIYVGSGTENAIDRALALLTPYREQIKDFVEDGKMLLATGTATELFGKCIDTERDSTQALGVLGYGAKRDKNRRILQDCLFESSLFEKKTLGFVNRCSDFYDTDNSLFTVSFGVGYDKKSKNEGFVYKNFMATTLIGPLLVRNPHVTKYVADRLFEISGDKPSRDADTELVEKAYNAALVELEKRANSKK